MEATNKRRGGGGLYSFGALVRGMFNGRENILSLSPLSSVRNAMTLISYDEGNQASQRDSFPGETVSALWSICTWENCRRRFP